MAEHLARVALAQTYRMAIRSNGCLGSGGEARYTEPLKHSRLRSAGSFGLALPLLIALFSLVGYVVTSETIRRDRDSDTARRVEADTGGAQVILGRARAYVVGLGNILAGEPVPGQRASSSWRAGPPGGSASSTRCGSSASPAWRAARTRRASALPSRG